MTEHTNSSQHVLLHILNPLLNSIIRCASSTDYASTKVQHVSRTKTERKQKSKRKCCILLFSIWRRFAPPGFVCMTGRWYVINQCIAVHLAATVHGDSCHLATASPNGNSLILIGTCKKPRNDSQNSSVQPQHRSSQLQRYFWIVN